jgi:hypothetical protein
MKKDNSKLDNTFNDFFKGENPVKHYKAVNKLLGQVDLVDEYNDLLEQKRVEEFFVENLGLVDDEMSKEEKMGIEELNKISKRLYKKGKYRELCCVYYDMCFRHIAEYLHLDEREDFEMITDYDLYKKNILPKEIFFQFFLLQCLVRNKNLNWDRDPEIINQNLACFIVCFNDIYEFLHDNVATSISQKQDIKDVFQLKIELPNSRPLIWRRILVPGNYTFWELHVAIQDAMGWFDCHLHQFCDRSFYGGKDCTYIKYPHPDDEDQHLMLGMRKEKYLDERTTLISEFLKKEKSTVWYEYDFGDSWMHKITLEKILPHDKSIALPSILAGKNMCPWEDSGGLPGFYDKVKMLKSDSLKKKDKEYYDELCEWVEEIDINDYETNGVFDPKNIDVTKFDMNEIEWCNPNEELQRFESYQ